MTSLAHRYRRFGETEAHGVSPLYETLAIAASEDPDIMAFVAALPPERQQPNLFIASVRAVAGLPEDVAALRRAIAEHGPAIRDWMLTHWNQTNEPGRCAVLLPALARIPGPLALIEVGASAGLCLTPDRYGYDYGRAQIAPPTPDAPVFPCAASETTPLPTAIPEIIWRAGLDRNPLDLADQSDRNWLQTLVWPEQTERAARLGQAIECARIVPMDLRRGDLLTDQPALLADAPAAATTVVFHTAVLTYVSEQSDRDRFVAMMREAGAVWLANESPNVFPEIAAKAPPAPRPGMFLLSVDGEPVAWTSPHGQRIDWFGG